MASRARGMSLSKTIRPCNRLITGGPVESRENPHDLYVSVCRELENMRDAVPVLDLILRDSPRVLEQFALVDPESQALRSVRPTSPLVRQFQREMQELLRLTRQLPEIGGGTISDEQQEWLETLNHYLQEAFRHLPGRIAGKSYGQDVFGFDPAVLNQIADSSDNDKGFPAACAGGYQQAFGPAGYRTLLVRVKPFQPGRIHCLASILVYY